jgi:hypothetical protein
MLSKDADDHKNNHGPRRKGIGDTHAMRSQVPGETALLLRSGTLFPRSADRLAHGERSYEKMPAHFKHLKLGDFFLLIIDT